MQQCVASHTEGLDPNDRRHTYYFERAESLCIGQHLGEERGLPGNELNLYLNDFARQHHTVPIETSQGTLIQPLQYATWIADARLDYRERCQSNAGDAYLVGPLDYGIYAERVAELGLEASERYLPCTLHLNGEIQEVRRLNDLGLRYVAP